MVLRCRFARWLLTAVWLTALVACGRSDEVERISLVDDFAAAADVPPAGLLEMGQRTQQPWRAPLATPVRPRRDWGRTTKGGWSPLGSSASLRLGTPPPGSSRLWLEILRLKRDEADVLPSDQTIEVIWTTPTDERALVHGPKRIRPGRNRLRLPIPQPTPSSSLLVLRFEPPLPSSGRGPTPIQVTDLAYLPRGADRPRRARPPVSRDEDGTLVRLHRAGRYAIPVRVPAGPSASVCDLVLELSLGGEPVPDDALEMAFIGLDGVSRPLELNTRRRGAPHLVSRASLTGLRGRRGVLTLETAAPTASQPLRIAAPRIEMQTLQASEPAEPARDTAVGQGPDVILIILDAARGDRIGGDYPRDVAPRIESLAEEGLLFRQAYSECPSTLCSIPHLITGIPLLAAGAEGRPGRLPDEVQTLAEVFQELGYRTVGFSANPYNSKSRNMDQGFEEFVALWGRNVPDHGPDGMVRRAAQTIASTPPDQPLFLQLHFLPPHEPYDPPPRFDRFRDPTYDGPIAARVPLRAYRTGLATLDPSDVEQLVALYDGNYLLADEAAGQVIDALRAAGRYDRAAVVVTADHGEAFMEHGLQGHNADLYEEMLHVPLVIKPPTGVPATSAWLQRPVSLGDLVPTLLSLVGRRPEAAAEGVDLLTAPARERLLTLRTTHATAPTWGLRSPRFKLIAQPSRGERRLFDLQADPGEQTNLAAVRPALWSALAYWLQQRIEAAKTGSEAEPAELDEEERSLLRALGYAE